MRAAEKANSRQSKQYFASFYRSIHGPKPGLDMTLVKPDSASDIAKGMPLTDYQKERLAGAAAELGGPDIRMMRRVCRDVGITDRATVVEVCRRQAALSTKYGIAKSEKWITDYRPEGKLGTPYRKKPSKKKSRDEDAEELEMVEDDKKRGSMKKHLSFESAADAANTLDELEKAINDQPISLNAKAQLRRAVLFAKSWGLKPEDTHPTLMKAAGLVLERAERTAGIAEDGERDDSRFMDIFVKAEGSKPSFQLSKKLLKPYLEIQIRDVSKGVAESWHWECQRKSKDAGFVGDSPPIPTPNYGALAERVWYRLVNMASRDYADKNLVLAMNMRSVTKNWVEKQAKKACRDHMRNMVFTPDQNLVPVTY